MRAHWLQHVPFEGLGTIGSWLRAREYRVTRTRFYEGDALPDPDELDFLIVMGGPMSVNDEGSLPWLRREKAFIRACVQQGKPVLGVCLGAQLIAAAMGGRVYRNPVKEIGWFPVEGVPAFGEGVFRFPQAFMAFHWHGETFDLPAGAVRIARTAACENQAFQLGRSVIGLQFHLEMTPEAVREMVAHGRGELAPSVYVQSEPTTLAAPQEAYSRMNDLMGEVLAFLTARAS